MHRLLLSAAILLVPLGSPAFARADNPDPSAALFEGGLIPNLRITLEPSQLDKLRQNPREYAEATIEQVGRPPFGPVGLKLKGAAGSYRNWEDRPALTVNMDKYRKKANFYGLTKFHLNNSVQDPSYLEEAVMADLFRQAGLPAPRVAHARVFLNGRDVGLYVLKEGFDRRFLARSFADPSGNLYDGGFCQDINADLEKDEGAGVDDRSDLKALVQATQEPDPARRHERVEALLDVDAFCGFMALERIGGHWDGYSGKANNYRVYFDPRTGKAVFLPHGMDQMFEDPNWGLFEAGSLISGQILQDPDFRRRYRAQLTRIIPLIDPPGPLQARVDAIEARLGPVLEATSRDWARHQREAAEGLKGAIAARAAGVRRQFDESEETSLDFDAEGVARLPKGWRSKTDGGQADFGRDEGNPPSFRISVAGGEPCVASWRRRVVLGPGRYVFRVDVRAEGVEPPPGTDKVGIGVGRGGTPRTQHRLGTSPLESMEHAFTVSDGQSTVELVLELRAKSGTVWFDQASVRLTRQGGP